MRVITLKLIRNDAFVLIYIENLILVAIVKAQNDAVRLTIIKYKENRRNSFQAFG